MARPVRGGGGRALAGLWCVCALLAAPFADGRAPLQHARAPTGVAAPECAQRLRGGGTASSAFGLDARELAELGQLRAALGADLAAAVVRNPDFATDDRLVRLLRANQNDVGRTVRFWPAMQRLRAEFGCDEIRAEVSLSTPPAPAGGRLPSSVGAPLRALRSEARPAHGCPCGGPRAAARSWW